MANHIQILDCTLRDGGMELQNAVKYNYIESGYSPEKQKIISECLRASGMDIIETCSISEDGKDRIPFAVYGNVKSASDRIGKINEGEQFAALYMGPQTDYSTIPDSNDVGIKMARMMLRYSELDASLDLCRELSRKGYSVFVQPSITMRYSKYDLEKIINLSNEIGAYALYIVDSYGYMSSSDVRALFEIYDASLNKGIRIGLHEHNNMNLAYSNVQEFIKIGTNRDLIVDSCLCGLGQGAGNLQTELIVNFANEHSDEIFGGAKYDIIPLLKACEIIDGFSDINYSWGYSTPRLIAAICRTSYKYGDILKMKYGFSYPMIYDLLSSIQNEEYRQRYTDEYADELVRLYRMGMV